MFATRMVTLTGPGGIGKTRLALHALTALAGEFPDGACYVELADTTSPDLVVARVAAAVGVTEEGDRPLLDTLADVLRARSLVLALDNCEHLLDACAGLCRQLLAAAPHLRLLATSREPLRVAGETIWSVAPLAVTSGDGSAGDAVRLFAERAGATAPGFTLTPGNADAVAEICRTLEGNPLAIELAAARVRALSVEQIRMRVADRFGLLTAGMRSAPARQQTLRAAIDWSHDLLTPREQALLRRLSVFAGWSLEMAEQVCADPVVPVAAMLDTLAALVDKSLAVREPEVLGQARFRLLETIREYAAERLAAAGEAAQVQHRLRDHVLAEAERNFAVGMALIPAPWQDRVDVFRRYDVDASNVWLVLSDCLAEGDVASGLRLCTAVRPCLLVRGEFALGCAWLDAFLARPEAETVDPRIKGQALIGRAQLTLPSDPAGAEELARAGLALSRAAHDDFWTATGLNLLSEIAVHTWRPDEAESLARQAMSVAESAQDGWNQGWALSIRAAIAGVGGRVAEAAELASASVTVMRSLDQLWGVARAQLGLGDLARRLGNHADAQRRYTDALTYLRQIDSRPEVARCLAGLGRVALELGDLALARAQLTESLRLCQATGTRIGVARGLASFAALARSEGDPERSVLLAAASAALREAAGMPAGPGAEAGRPLAGAHGLDEPALARLRARGRALSAEEAIALATEPGPGALADAGLTADRADRADGADGSSISPASLASLASPADEASAGGLAAGGASAGGLGLSPLTQRELEIARLVAQGRSNKHIAAGLVVSPATVARHVANIMGKLDFHNRAQIAAWIVSEGA
jgi:predicted ATPase/DNA-binding CsgD family transcriptional regulator